MLSDREGARRWQQLAEEASSIAREMTDPEATQIMRHVVQGYGILVRRIDARGHFSAVAADTQRNEGAGCGDSDALSL